MRRGLATVARMLASRPKPCPVSSAAQWNLAHPPTVQDTWHATREDLHSVLTLYTSSAAQYAKKGGRGGKSSAAAAAAEKQAQEEEQEAEFSLDPYDKQMSQAFSHFQQELGKIHAGRASPGLLEPIEVVGHNERLPLKNYGAVTARSPSLLVVAPFNPGDADLVAKAIRDSPLKLQARVEGKEVHVPVPRPTLDQIKGLVKLVAQEAEKSKHSVRVARQRAMEAVKSVIKAKDDRVRTEKQVQALTDKWTSNVDQLKSSKDKDLETHVH